VRRLALLVVLAGCDKLFDLEPVTDPADAGDGDAGVIDDGPPPDMVVCDASEHDEDSDLIPDRCDACPTYAAITSGDNDNDGLPNECDQNDAASMKDRIEAYWTFPTAADLADFTYTGSMPGHTTNERGMAQLASGTALTTMLSATPTRVELHVFGMITQDFNSKLRIQVGTTTLCTVSGAQCDGATAGMCVSTGPMNNSNLTTLSGALRRVSLFRTGATSLGCSISSGTATSIAINPLAPLGGGQITIELSANASVQLQALVIYGAK